MKMKLLGMLLVGLAVALSGCQRVESVRYVDPDDPLTGYFRIEERRRKKTQPATIIPVLKIEGTYYSVCRGYEIPFRQGPGGLEWDMPSSMVGTTIGQLPDGSVFIIIRDAQSEDFTRESECPHDTGLRPMRRSSKPASVLDVTALAPVSNDDFVGCYQLLWSPYYRVEIRKEGEEYFADAFFLSSSRGKMLDKEAVELLPLADELGFSNFDKKHSITYSQSLKRFEIVKTTTPVIRMPLVRISSDAPASDVSVAIGIPSWH